MSSTSKTLTAALCASLLLTACVSTPAKLWPFGGTKSSERSQQPIDATEYRCAAGKRFHVRMIDNGEAAWLILPDREVRLARAAGGARFSNGIAVLDINGDEATLKDGSAAAITCKTAPGGQT